MIEVRVRDALSKRRVTELLCLEAARWSKFFCFVPSLDCYKISGRATLRFVTLPRYLW